MNGSDRRREPAPDRHVPGRKTASSMSRWRMNWRRAAAVSGITRRLEVVAAGGPNRFTADPRREADLLVEASKRFLDRGELGLDLDDEQRSGRSVEGRGGRSTRARRRCCRSPPTACSQPRFVSDRIAAAAQVGMALRRSIRSRLPPRQRTSTSPRASRASRTRRSVLSENVSTCPRSTSEIDALRHAGRGGKVRPGASRDGGAGRG